MNKQIRGFIQAAKQEGADFIFYVRKHTLISSGVLDYAEREGVKIIRVVVEYEGVLYF